MQLVRQESSGAAVRATCRRPRTGYKTGAQHHRARLTTEEVDAMRDAYDNGEGGYGALARRFGCGESTVRDIVLCRTRTTG